MFASVDILRASSKSQMVDTNKKKKKEKGREGKGREGKGKDPDLVTVLLNWKNANRYYSILVLFNSS